MWTKKAKSSHYKICTFSGDNLVWRNDSCARKGASVGADWIPWSWEQWASARFPEEGSQSLIQGGYTGTPGHPRAHQTSRPCPPWSTATSPDHLALINWQVHHGSRPNVSWPPVDTNCALCLQNVFQLRISRSIFAAVLSHFSVLFKVFAGFSPPYFSVSRWPVITGRKQSCVHCPQPCWAVSSQLKQLIGRLDPTFSLNGKLAVSKNQSSAGQFLRPFCLEKSHFQAQVNTMDKNIKENYLVNSSESLS